MAKVTIIHWKTALTQIAKLATPDMPHNTTLDDGERDYFNLCRTCLFQQTTAQKMALPGPIDALIVLNILSNGLPSNLIDHCVIVWPPSSSSHVLTLGGCLPADKAAVYGAYLSLARGLRP